ncbi:hypothetical protein Tco_0876027 [Tanacetum coccineum]|uniref:Retrotransposon gag domain-containing protein n=1 Tax=Tanacetum coccineum TaxID=301880 RepID=A0ABQ5BRG7_9ASTR
MDDQRTMAHFLKHPPRVTRMPSLCPKIPADNFDLSTNCLPRFKTSNFFLRTDKEDPHAQHLKFQQDHFSTMKFLDVPSKATTFYEAWDRFNDLLRACPHHGFSELHQLDTFYNALNSNDQDSLNSAAGGNFLDKMPRDCLRIIESKSKVRNSRNKPVVAKVSASTSTPGISSEVAELKDMVKALLLDKKNQSPAPTPVKAVEESCVTCGGAHSYQTLVEQEPKVTKEMMPPTNNRSTATEKHPISSDCPYCHHGESILSARKSSVSAFQGITKEASIHFLQEERERLRVRKLTRPN